MMFTIRGIPTAGIAVGTAFVLQRRTSAAATAAAGDPVAEAGRFHAALERAKAELSALAEGEAVFTAHLEMAGDPMLAGLVEGRIAEKHLSAEQALGEACEEVCGMFAALDDDYLRGRTDDVRDVCARIRRVLSGKTAHDPFAGLAPGTIVVADELAPSDTAQMDFSRVAGLVTAHGSMTSHVAIIARNKGIAALVGVAGCMRQVRTGDRLIIDGERGELIVDPDPATGQNTPRGSNRCARMRSAARRMHRRPPSRPPGGGSRCWAMPRTSTKCDARSMQAPRASDFSGASSSTCRARRSPTKRRSLRHTVPRRSFAGHVR